MARLSWLLLLLLLLQLSREGEEEEEEAAGRARLSERQWRRPALCWGGQGFLYSGPRPRSESA